MRIGFLSDFVIHEDIKITNKLKNILLQNDFNILNLEAPFVEKNFKYYSPGINLFNKTFNVDFLIKNKFKYVSLANNHIFDFGLKGFRYSIEILKKNNINYFGAGEDISKSRRPIIIKINNASYGFWGFASSFTGAINSSNRNFGTNPLNFKNIKKCIQPYKDIDFKIVYFHFGIEFENYPDPFQKHLIDSLFKHDIVDVVIGSHSHCPQGYYEKNINSLKKIAFYSLGNFILPEVKYLKESLNYPEESHIGYFVNLSFGKNLEYEIVPYKLISSSLKAVELSIQEKLQFWDKIIKLSEPLKLSYSEYKIFYKIHKKSKLRPTMTRNQWTNTIKFRYWYKKFWLKRKLKTRKKLIVDYLNKRYPLFRIIIKKLKCHFFM